MSFLRVWLFTSRLGNPAVTRSKPIWLDVTIVTVRKCRKSQKGFNAGLIMSR